MTPETATTIAENAGSGNSGARGCPLASQRAVWLCVRFTPSYRDVEERLAERGIEVANETIRRWVPRFGRLYAKRLRRRRPKPDDRRHLDEMFVSIRGKRMYPWRAVDGEGGVPDFLIQSRRDGAAALKPMRRLLRKPGLRTPRCRHGQAALPRFGIQETSIVGAARAGVEEEQSSQEFPPTGPAADAKNSALQIRRVGPALSLASPPPSPTISTSSVT